MSAVDSVGWNDWPNGTAPSRSLRTVASLSGLATTVPSRRRMMRLPATRDVWVYWECGGRADVSRVRDLSTGGIFIETAWRRTKGEVVRVHFLVQEGQITLDGVVAQAQPSQGLGLKFQTVATKDISKLTLLLDRVRAAFRAEATACRSSA